MPPLPLKFDEETLKLLDAVERHAKDIEDFQIPRLRSCEGPFAVQQTLASELREDVDALARQVEALDVLVDDQRGASNKRGLRTIVEELSERLNAIRRESRAALLASKRTLDSLSNSRRDELLGSASVSEKQGSNGRFAEDALMAASDKVTDAMQRTMELMDAELKRSVLVSQTLADSTATLKSTSLTHDTLTTVLDTSKHLVTALEKADTLDRLLIGAALVLFILVVLFILKQRIFDRGMRVAFWWTRFLPDFSGDGDLLNVEKGTGTFEIVSSTLASTASSILTVSTAEAAHLAENTLSVLATLESLSATLESIPTASESPSGASESASESPSATPEAFSTALDSFSTTQAHTSESTARDEL